MSFTLPKHPISMKTLFRDCFLVNFAVDPNVMRSLLPAPLEPDLYDGSAFLSVVIVDMERMRPVFLPKFCGISYTQVLYRTFVVYQGEHGVHFLHTDANNPLMCLLGNAMTIFPFHLARVSEGRTGPYRRFDLTSHPSQHADIHALFDLSVRSQVMPSTSRFPSLAQAQEFLVQRYVAFAPEKQTMNSVRIRRGEWVISVVNDLKRVYQFMQGSTTFPAGCAEIDSLFHVADVPYVWSRLEHRRL